MRRHGGLLRNLLTAIVVSCAIGLSGGAAKAVTVTHNGEPVFDILDHDFIPDTVGDSGDVSKIYRNMTDVIVNTLRIIFITALSQNPDVRGGSVLQSSVDEVIYTNLNIQTEQLFRLRLIGLVPESRFALATNNIAPLDESEIERITDMFDSPSGGGSPGAQVPLPFPILLLGSGLVLLWGVRFRTRRTGA